MSGTATARRYAKALFDLGDEEKLLDSLREKLDAIKALIGTEAQIEDLFRNPVYHAADKKKVLETLSKETGSPPLLVRFLDLLNAKNRLPLLSEIAEHFGELVDEVKGRQKVRLHVARDLDGAQKKHIQEKLKTSLERDIQIEVVSDASLIGGMVVYAGNRVFDGSVRGQLLELRKGLMQDR
ncbi:MAG TPA: F0F1 ATP synthase subunit delta [Nitrospiria bacterium]